METIVADGPTLPQVPAHLTEIYVTGYELEDVSSLAAASDLTHVEIGYAPELRDVDVFLELPRLREVSLNVEKSTLAGLGHPNLEVATIFCQHPQADPGLLDPLAGATALRELTLMVPGGCELTCFGSMDALRTLSLNLYAPVAKLDPMASLSLERLCLQLDARVNLTPIKKITTLTELELSSHHKVDLKFLRGLRTLHTLDLTGCSNVPKLEGLEGAQALTTLAIDVQRQPDFAPLSGLSSLTELTLRQGFSYIPAEERAVDIDLSELTGLVNLRGLHFVGVALSDLGFLTRMPALEHLSITACVIRDARAEELLRRMPALERVTFTGAPRHDSAPDWSLPGVTYETSHHDVDPWGN